MGFSQVGRLAAVLALVSLASWGCDEDDGADRVVRWWGGTGRGHCEFSYPRAMTFGAGDLLYVVDKAARIQRFTRKGDYQLEWRMPACKLGKPTGLTTDRAGNVYVADTHYSRVMVYSSDGTLLRQFGSFGHGPGQFIYPTDVLVDQDQTIYVGEYGGNDRISKFTADGQFLLAFGDRGAGEASLTRPSALAMDEHGTIYVADTCNHRICRFTRSGEFRGSFGKLGSGPGELRYPHDVSVGPDGTLWVVEFGNNRIQQFDRQGNSLRVWGTAGRNLGQLAYPWGILAAKDEIYVLDSGNNRVQVIQP